MALTLPSRIRFHNKWRWTMDNNFKVKILNCENGKERNISYLLNRILLFNPRIMCASLCVCVWTLDMFGASRHQGSGLLCYCQIISHYLFLYTLPWYRVVIIIGTDETRRAVREKTWWKVNFKLFFPFHSRK